MNVYLELVKPRLTLMAMATAFGGYWLGTTGAFDKMNALRAMIGVLLVGAAANSLNQYLEREFDPLMARTAARPLPSRRLLAGQALFFGLATAISGILWLYVFTGSVAAGLGFLTLLSYLAVYTPLKRRTPWNTLAGALPGALPVLIGTAAAGAAIDLKSLSYFLFLFVWQLPHFFAIAWIYREDYERAGYAMITKGDPQGRRTAFGLIATALLTVLFSLLPFLFGAAGLTYLFIAIFTGALFAGWAWYVYDRRMTEARPFVAASILYLFVINIMLIIDRA